MTYSDTLQLSCLWHVELIDSPGIDLAMKPKLEVVVRFEGVICLRKGSKSLHPSPCHRLCVCLELRAPSHVIACGTADRSSPDKCGIELRPSVSRELAAWLLHFIDLINSFGGHLFNTQLDSSPSFPKNRDGEVQKMPSSAPGMGKFSTAKFVLVHHSSKC